jgi:hypothetical protein
VPGKQTRTRHVFIHHKQLRTQWISRQQSVS